MSANQAPIPVTPVRYDDPMEGLFLCMHVADGGSEAVKFDISTTIGMGGLRLIVDVEQEGKPKVRESVDLAELVQAWVNQIVSTT